MRRARQAVAVVVAALLLVTGCGGDDSGTSGSARGAPDSSTRSNSDSSSPPGTQPPATVDVAAPGFPPARSETVVDRREFTSPTGNITCQMDRTYATCLIGEHDYPVPPRAADCELDWAPLFSVGTGGNAVFGSCEGGVVVPSTSLPYGTTSVVGPMTCLSRQTGMFCWNSRTGHGFRVARATYHLH